MLHAEVLRDMAQGSLQRVMPRFAQNHFLSVLLADDAASEWLTAGCTVECCAVHREAMYYYAEEPAPRAERLARNELLLPCHPLTVPLPFELHIAHMSDPEALACM